MNTARNIVIAITLLGVGYGAHVVLSQPDPTASTELDDAETYSAPLVDLDGARQLRPDVSLELPEDHRAISGPAEESLEQSIAVDPAVQPIGPQVENELTTKAPFDPPSENPLAHAAPTAEVEIAENAAVASPADASAYTPSSPDETAVVTSDSATVDIPSKPNTDAMESLWSSVQSKLERGDLADALLALSIWYSDPNTTDQQRSEVLPIMDQLAGTVIYSRDHLLEQPHTVQAGETLGQIAEKYLVPATLLAKINGLASPDTLSAGETLKVVRGPFRAEASMTRGELTLFLRHYYAGRFRISFGDGVSMREATLAVVEKLGQQKGNEAAVRHESPPGTPSVPRHWIGLAGAEGTASGTIGIHSSDEPCGAEDSRGCIKLDPQDAEDLQAILSLGSTVTILR